MATGTRQYIGARYVPLFGRQGEESIEWDNEAPYEPLTIVLHEGDSYTSRQFVPIGIEITNTQYWAKTGAYNAQIELLRQEVARQADVILDLSEDVVDLTNRVNTAESDITSLDGRVTNTESDIEELTTKLNHNVPIANVKDYGAVGDGETDDTQAFQDAIDTGYDVYVPSANNEVYLITDTLNLDNTGQTIFSDFCNSRTINFQPESTQSVLFNISVPMTIKGITASCNEIQGGGQGGIAIKADDPNTRNDTDVLIENCGFTGFYNTIYFIGRGLYIHNSQITNSDIGIKISWDNDESHDPIHGNMLGYRAHRIISTRFHSIQNYSIYIDSGTDDAPMTGMLISNNMLDYGRGRFLYSNAKQKFLTIIGNYIGYASQRGLDFNKSVENSIITGNNFFADSNFLSSNYGIYFAQIVKNLTISGNSFNNFVNNAIRINAGAEFLNINSNTFNNNSLSVNSSIYIGVKLNYSTINGNSCNNFDSFIQNSGTPQYTSSRIIGNSSNTTSFIKNAHTDTNTDIEYNGTFS